MITRLEFKEHRYFGHWFEDDNPPAYATIMGPVDAYAPLNYNEVATGSGFVKFRGGVINKPSNEAYSKFSDYSIIDSGTWDIKTKADEVQFVHILNNDNYSYEYSKTVKFVKNQPKWVSVKIKPCKSNIYRVFDEF